MAGCDRTPVITDTGRTAEVFSVASRPVAGNAPAYRVEIAAAQAGPLPTAAGIGLVAARSLAEGAVRQVRSYRSWPLGHRGHQGQGFDPPGPRSVGVHPSGGDAPVSAADGRHARTR
ncbi:hypothetical protein ACIQVT_01850 [Streptomyces sp. NPDC100445]|uniref:hypothetical protein n=1 Tax=Streptomyces sp. NPDC100445 TaxID=3366102 RepID=UPI003808B577